MNASTGNYMDDSSPVNSVTREESGRSPQGATVQSSIGDRLRFVIWLSALRLGAWTSKEFASAIGKAESQIPRWVREAPRPDWPNIKDLASSAGVSAAWLDDPRSADAKEPELFPEWLTARRAFLARYAQDDARPDYLRAAERSGGEVISANNDERFRPTPSPKKKAAGDSPRRKR